MVIHDDWMRRSFHASTIHDHSRREKATVEQVEKSEIWVLYGLVHFIAAFGMMYHDPHLIIGMV